MEAWRDELYHYAKGETAKNHKYIRKEGNRYIYADDNKGSTKNKSGIGNWLSGTANSVGNWVSGAANSVSSFVQNVTDPAVVKEYQKLSAAKTKLNDYKNKNAEWVADYKKAQETLKSGTERIVKRYNLTHDTTEEINVDDLLSELYHEYWIQKEPSGARFRALMSNFLYDLGTKTDKRDFYENMAENFDYDSLYTVLSKSDSYRNYKSDIRFYEDMVEKHESRLKELKHTELSHGCLGDTAIIHRF